MSISSNTFNLSTNIKNTPSSSTLLHSYSNLNTSRASKTLTPQQLQKKFDDLYNQNERWKAKKQKLRQQRNSAKSLQDMKQCTFKPQVNPQIGYNGSNPSPFLKRQMDWLRKKQNKIEQMAKESQRKLKKVCSFHPKISKNTISILNDPNKTSRLLFSPNEQTEHQNVYSKRYNNSYKQIHMKKQSLKQLSKTSSFQQFNLMTERRFIKKMQQQTFNQLNQHSHKKLNYYGSKLSLNSPKITKVTLPQSQDYIENIVMKSQEQDTFNSVSSLEMKTQRKQHLEAQIQKQPVKIFQQQEPQEQDDQQIEHEHQQIDNDVQQIRNEENIEIQQVQNDQDEQNECV